MALTDNLISYWKLDEASGNAVDAHSTNDLTDNNTVGAGTGKISGGRDFETGSSEYFSRADNAALSTGDIDFTLQFWFKHESFTSNQSIGAKATDGGVHEWIIYVDGSGFLEFQVNSFAENAGTFPSALSTDTWYLLHAWHDSVNNLIGISLNAGTPITASYSGGVTDGSGDFNIGASPANSWYFDGIIDEVGFWKRVLTSQERTDLYNGGAGLAYSSFSAASAGPLTSGGRLTKGVLIRGGRLVGA